MKVLCTVDIEEEIAVDLYGFNSARKGNYFEESQ